MKKGSSEHRGYLSLYARVQGIVQGVGFRYSAIIQARRLGLTGYVRNMPDGTVEVLAEGPKEDLGKLHRWLQRGPSAAIVRRVEHRYQPYSGGYRDFGVKY